MPTKEILAFKKQQILKKLSHIYNDCKIYVFFDDYDYITLKVTIKHKWLNCKEIHFDEILDISVVANQVGLADWEVGKIVSAVDKEILKMWKG